MENKEELLKRFKTTLDILMPTFEYVDMLHDEERDFCEQAFHEISPCYIFMYSIVVGGKLPDAYSTIDAQLEMFDKIKFLAGISAVEYRRLRTVKDNLDQYQLGFYALLETLLLMYRAYMHGIEK